MLESLGVALVVFLVVGSGIWVLWVWSSIVELKEDSTRLHQYSLAHTDRESDLRHRVRELEVQNEKLRRALTCGKG